MFLFIPEIIYNLFTVKSTTNIINLTNYTMSFFFMNYLLISSTKPLFYWTLLYASYYTPSLYYALLNTSSQPVAELGK